MKIIETYENILNNATNIVQIIVYTISFILISMSIATTTFTYFTGYFNPSIDNKDNFTYARLSLGEGTALALSFILGVEILRLFFIKTYKQLLFVVCLVVIKLIINWFVLKEISTN